MLAYTTTGSGPALVLLHGFPLTRAIWADQIADLGQRYQVIAPDLPGHGQSAPLSGDAPPTMARMAQEVLALMDFLGIDHAAVAGHSMGGYVALALLKLAPQRVTGLGLVASQAHPDSPEAAAGRRATAQKVLAAGAGIVADSMGPKLFAPGVLGDASIRRQTDAMMRATPVQGVYDALLAMADREDMRDLLGTVRVPSLIVAGAEDAIIPAERIQDMTARLPAAALVTITGAGHMPMLEAPEATSAALAHWLGNVYVPTAQSRSTNASSPSINRGDGRQ